MIYPGESHEIERPSFVLDRMERYLAWYGEYLGGSPAGGERGRPLGGTGSHAGFEERPRWRMLGLVALLLGCAGKLGGCGRGVAAVPEHNAEVALEVENHGWSDIVIYLVRGTAAERLGMVGSAQHQDLRVSLPQARHRHRRPAARRSDRRAEDVHQREPAGAAGAVDQVDAGERSDAVVSGGVLEVLEEGT